MDSKFTVSDILSMCYNGDFGLSENESICDDGEDVHAYLGQRVVAPEEGAALSRADISEPIVSGSRSAFVEAPFVDDNVSTHAEENQEQSQGE